MTFILIDFQPKLQDVQARLEAKGLKNPWLRNEVWRYDHRITPSALTRFKSIFGQGLLPGLALGIGLTIWSNWAEARVNAGKHHDDH